MAQLFLRMVASPDDATVDYGNGPRVAPMVTREMVSQPCHLCDGTHDALWTVARVLVDTFGHFPVYRLNGADTVVDGSLPHAVDRLPRDARAVPYAEASRYWHDETGSHTFGASDPGAALRARIAEHNARDARSVHEDLTARAVHDADGVECPLCDRRAFVAGHPIGSPERPAYIAGVRFVARDR